MNTLATPDITLMQKLVGGLTGLLVAVLGLVQAFGVDITPTQNGAILTLWTALGSVLVIADAVIRNGRSRALAANPPAVAVESGDKTKATIAG